MFPYIYIHIYIYVINRVFRLRSREATSRKAARFRVSGSGTIETGAMQCTRWQCARVEECEPADWSGAVSHPGEKTCREGRVAARLFRRENDVAENDAKRWLVNNKLGNIRSLESNDIGDEALLEKLGEGEEWTKRIASASCTYTDVTIRL